MQATLMDIELLTPPTLSAEPVWVSWVLLAGGLLLLFAALLLWRWLWRQPGLVLWRWQRALHQGKTVRELALEIYVWQQQTTSKHSLNLSLHQTDLLHQACFGADEVSMDEFDVWLNQLKQAVTKT